MSGREDIRVALSTSPRYWGWNTGQWRRRGGFTGVWGESWMTRQKHGGSKIAHRNIQRLSAGWAGIQWGPSSVWGSSEWSNICFILVLPSVCHLKDWSVRGNRDSITIHNYLCVLLCHFIWTRKWHQVHIHPKRLPIHLKKSFPDSWVWNDSGCILKAPFWLSHLNHTGYLSFASFLWRCMLKMVWSLKTAASQVWSNRGFPPFLRRHGKS